MKHEPHRLCMIRRPGRSNMLDDETEARVEQQEQTDPKKQAQAVTRNVRRRAVVSSCCNVVRVTRYRSRHSSCASRSSLGSPGTAAGQTCDSAADWLSAVSDRHCSFNRRLPALIAGCPVCRHAVVFGERQVHRFQRLLLDRKSLAQ